MGFGEGFESLLVFCQSLAQETFLTWLWGRGQGMGRGWSPSKYSFNLLLKKFILAWLSGKGRGGSGVLFLSISCSRNFPYLALGEGAG